ncbi:hypothetical protein PFLG_00830 [Plasmodium falciparum RAJ116]|uniref:Uncharacterized protein n=1 Tax=Plasmodium falciparum RAJ116 TaxID=580058 RepID=A0A0L0CUI6_PLAFA|nr:hypothetical protein PFLG_00830 [Plasmodium falciparum RAJ116]
MNNMCDLQKKYNSKNIYKDTKFTSVNVSANNVATTYDECIFLNNNKQNKRIIWNIIFDALRKKFISDVKNVNYVLKIFKYTFSFFSFQKNLYLKRDNRTYIDNYIHNTLYNFRYISSIYLKELLKFCLSFITNILYSKHLTEEIIFKSISYIFHLLSKLLCNTNNDIKEFILCDTDNNIVLISIITHIYKYFKKLYFSKNNEEVEISKSNNSKNNNVGVRN